MNEPPIDALRKVLQYDPLTGIFRWRIAQGSRAKKGAVAGCVWTDKWGKEYIVIRVLKQLHRAHRLAWALHTGSFPSGQIDHEDGDGLNNRILNLRVVTHRENGINQKLRSTNKSGYFGVVWNEPTNSWRVGICVKGKNVHLGMFTDKTAAISTRKAAEKFYGFHENHGRQVL